MIGKILRVKLREVWKHEALDFTTWLEENVDVLNDALDLTLVNVDHDAQVELYIDADHDSGEGNKAIFDQLKAQKEKVEQEFGDPLEWDALEGKRACRIRKVIPIAGWQDEDRWPEAHEAMTDAMINLERALRPHLKQLNVVKA